MNWARLILVCAVVGLVSCDKEPQEATRSFRMGFTSIPRKLSSKATEYTYQQLALASDITNHQFDGGVPWPEAFSESEFSHSIIQDWAYRKTLTPSAHKVLVSVSPLRVDGKGIAKYLGDQENMILMPPWDKYSFKDDAVRIAYLNYCRRLIQYFNPEFFNMSAEANILYLRDPIQWKEFLSFHKFVYENLKKEFPGVIIFTSVAASQMIADESNGYDNVKQKLAVLQVIENSDLYALAFKPGQNVIKNYKDNSFLSLFNISSKPLAVAETGFELQAASDQSGSTGDLPDAQPRFISTLLKESEVHKATFIINSALKSQENLLKRSLVTDQKDMAYKIFLNDKNGIQKPPVAVWNDYQKRTYKP